MHGASSIFHSALDGFELVGLRSASVEIAIGLKKRGYDAKFVATGQTGIMIEGDGCPVDCVVSDFVTVSYTHLTLPTILRV